MIACAKTGFAILAMCLILTDILIGSEPPQRVETDQLRKDALLCASMLHVFERQHEAAFPKGLEAAERIDGADGGVFWPPPERYSWRVALLPNLEEALLYEGIHKASQGFAKPEKLTEAELAKLPTLKSELDRMPKWLTLERWKAKPAHSIYRRLVLKEDKSKFIVVETSDLAPWFRNDDDVVLDDKKPLPKMGGNFSTGFFALCGDGKVRFLSSSLSEKQIRLVLTTGEGVKALRTSQLEHLKADINALDFMK